MSSEANNSNSRDLYYLAIGSMMLPESYRQRNFHPLASQPAELLDYKLNFFGPSGFAEAVPAPGESLHGVMHKVTPQQMLELDKIEVGYIRQVGKARPYYAHGHQGEDEEKEKTKTIIVLDVTVYCRPNREERNNPPMERYLEILIAGAKHFGVDPKYIEFLQNHDFRPRNLPKDFKTFGDPPSDEHFTNVPETNEEDGTIYFSLNGKVLELSYPPDHPHGNFFVHLRKSKGPHFEVGISQLSLDLKYGVVKDIKDYTKEHSAYLEDGQYRFMEEYNTLMYCKPIGTFSPPH